MRFLHARRDDGLSAEELDVVTLDEARRERLRADMLSINEAAYRGSPARGYVDWMTDPQIFDRYQRVALFRREGRAVGYFHGFVRRVDVGGREVEVLRSSAATLPGERANGLVGKGYRLVAMHFARRHLVARGPRYYAAVCLSPITYGMIGRRSRCLFPRPGATADPELERIHRAIHGEAALIPRPVSSFETPEMLSRIKASDDPFVRFYLEANPRFDEGFGLPITVRVNAGDTLYALAAAATLGLARRLPAPLRR